jgi:hypothetical protein
MDRTDPHIRAARPGDADQTAELLAAVLTDDPVIAWLMPSVEQRRQTAPAFFSILVERCIKYGQVEIIPGAAAALWLHYTGPLPAQARFDERMTGAGQDIVRRVRVLDELLQSRRPTRPHHHLAFLGVVPEQHGHGLDVALLHHHHDALDQDNLPAYLEASNPRSRRLYRLLGYTTQNPIVLPGGGPFVWPMTRQPMSPETNAIVKRYAANESIRAIGKALNMSYATVHRHLTDANVEIRPPGGNQRRTASHHDRASRYAPNNRNAAGTVGHRDNR